MLVESPGETLDAGDLERLAVAAYLFGHDERSAAAWEDAYRRHLEDDEPADAAECAFWLALCSMLRGQMAHASGWLSRCEGAIESDLDCAAVGYLLIPTLLGALEANDPTTARDLAIRASRIAVRFDDSDLSALALLGHGQALIALGETEAGTTLLDEVMLSVAAGEVGPITSGIVYCAVILECMQIFDLARAAEWTNALAEWCDAQPDLVPYRGQCLVHRSQLQQASGDWSTAITTVVSACDRLKSPPHPALGSAYYQQAELHRLLGEFDSAASMYRQASRSGYEPMPGMALLELAHGNANGAAAAIGRALHETGQSANRPAFLAAAVDIYIEAKDLEAARAAAEDLAAISTRSTSKVLEAMADRAIGTVLLGEGEPSLALIHLRNAAMAWQRVRLPYEAARTAVILGLCCIALGDGTTATFEFDNAHEAFTELGGQADIARLESLSGIHSTPNQEQVKANGSPALSARELEVLSNVAAGKTNRAIATTLSISPHTVNRHLENIFAKLGVNGRAAATAYAYEHDLL